MEADALTINRTKWREEFGRWFRDVIDRAGILDYRYPLKGCGVWLGYGFKIRQQVLEVIRGHLDATGHEEMRFPTLIPEDLIAKESTHIQSFEGEAYWVTHGGSTPLNVRLALRPTSETTITPMVKLWVRSHADLPKKIYQIGSIFRYETKATRPLIRVREVSTFKEAHTFHADHPDAAQQVEIANTLYTQIFDQLCLPYLISPRPTWDKFAGALTTHAFDTLLPDGRSLQIGTTHDLGQNFARAFEFTFETQAGGREYPWQTSYGISERAIAAVISVHGDDRGLVLPPRIAPIQVVVVPILYKGTEATVDAACAAATQQLADTGLRVHLDNRPEPTPGSKFYDWELRGVPLRVEIGPRDVAQQAVTLVRRDTLDKVVCPQAELPDRARATLATITEQLRQRAWAWMTAHVHPVDSITQAKAIVDQGQGVAELAWCGSDDCGLELEKRTDAQILGTTERTDAPGSGTCAICTRAGTAIARLAKAY